MFNFFISLSTSDKIQIISIISSTLISVISIGIAVATLKQSNYIARESNRADIVFFIDKKRTESFYSLIIKNFGNSSGKVIDIDIDPKLSYENSRFSIDKKVLTDYKNIFLAPGQSITSVFDFQSYPDREFNIKITYETLGKTYSESYTINLDYRDGVLSTSPTIRDTATALKQINESIREVSDKLI